MNNRVQSTGTVEKIDNGVAWGVFHAGFRDGSTFDIPSEITTEDGVFFVKTGNEVMHRKTILK